VDLQLGSCGRATLVVAEQDTAAALGTGTVPVLASPRLIALCERAACDAVERHLPPGTTTVGSRVQFDHLAPVAVGTEVVADATLARVEGRRLTFTVSASDAAGLVGAGRLTRVVVGTEAFMAKVR
jgi:predicted thioesterase